MADTMGESAFPLQWPLGRPRVSYRTRSKFKTAHKSFAEIRDELLRELKRYGARQAVLSTNLRLRLDGLPLSGQSRPDDPGVAVYFTDRKGRRICFACDKWVSVEENAYSIAMTINAIRGIGRWGMEEAVDAAFTGFTALPPPASNGFASAGDAAQWLSEVIGRPLDKPIIFESRSHYEGAYRTAAKKLHPDAGGDENEFKRLQAASALLEKHHAGIAQ